MRSDKKWSRTHTTLAIGHWVFIVTGAIIAGLLQVKPESLKGGLDIVKPWLEPLQSKAGLVIPCFIAGAKLCEYIGKKIGEDWVWQNIKFHVNKFRDDVFEGIRGPQHHHRVTLFKHVPSPKWYRFWDRCGVLVPVERSGHATRTDIPSFRAPSDADKAEGVAGITWAVNDLILVEDLPDLTAGDAATQEQNLEKYARRIQVDKDWLRKRRDSKKSRSRSFCGIPVWVAGRIWGVILLDSRKPAMPNRDRIRTEYKYPASSIAKLLESD